MNNFELENEMARIRVELLDLESLDIWSDYEKERYLLLKQEYFKLLNQMNEGVVE